MLNQFNIPRDVFDGPVLVTGAGGCIGAWTLSLLTDAEVDYKEGYPPTINENISSEFALKIAKEVAGANASDQQMPVMGSEDFSYFLQEKPGAYAFIGNGNSASLHNPSYDFNDDNLPIGASFLARIAENKLL